MHLFQSAAPLAWAFSNELVLEGLRFNCGLLGLSTIEAECENA